MEYNKSSSIEKGSSLMALLHAQTWIKQLHGPVFGNSYFIKQISLGIQMVTGLVIICTENTVQYNSQNRTNVNDKNTRVKKVKIDIFYWNSYNLKEQAMGDVRNMKDMLGFNCW